jgi:hypothetical protein
MGTSIGVKINAFNSELAHVVKSVSTPTLNRKNELTVKLLAVLEQHAAGENKIFSNESLSSQGKQAALAKLGTTETAPALKWLRNVLKEMQEKDQRYRTQFFTITSGIEDAVERMLMFTYLWSRLDHLDQGERVTQFVQASEQDKVVVLSAMLENPLGPMVTVDVKRRILTERATRLTPRDYENFEQNAILLEYFVMARDWVGRWLFGEVGVEIKVIRDALGDELGDMLTQQTTGIPRTETELAGASK